MRRVQKLGSGAAAEQQGSWRKGSCEKLVWRCTLPDQPRLYRSLRPEQRRVIMVFLRQDWHNEIVFKCLGSVAMGPFDQLKSPWSWGCWIRRWSTLPWIWNLKSYLEHQVWYFLFNLTFILNHKSSSNNENWIPLLSLGILWNHCKWNLILPNLPSNAFWDSQVIFPLLCTWSDTVTTAFLKTVLAAQGRV